MNLNLFNQSDIINGQVLIKQAVVQSLYSTSCRLLVTIMRPCLNHVIKSSSGTSCSSDVTMAIQTVIRGNVTLVYSALNKGFNSFLGFVVWNMIHKITHEGCSQPYTVVAFSVSTFSVKSPSFVYSAILSYQKTISNVVKI